MRTGRNFCKTHNLDRNWMKDGGALAVSPREFMNCPSAAALHTRLHSGIARSTKAWETRPQHFAALSLGGGILFPMSCGFSGKRNVTEEMCASPRAWVTRCLWFYLPFLECPASRKPRLHFWMERPRWQPVFKYQLCMPGHLTSTSPGPSAKWVQPPLNPSQNWLVEWSSNRD